jgi:GAF domain-containing protein
MKNNYDESSSTRLTLGVRHVIQRFLLHGVLAFFLRFFGFFLLGLIAYLHFFFDSVNPDHLSIEAWILSYLGYLIILEYFRHRKFPSYDATWFVLVRIFSNIFLISWLLYAAPLLRGILSFMYLVPFIACIVYFPRNQKLLGFLYASSILVLSLATVILDPRTPLSLGQLMIVATILGLALIALKYTYAKVSGMPEVISAILTRLQNTFDFEDILNQIAEGVSMITGGDQVFILIVDPEDRSYVTHKIYGLNLSGSFKMEELIRQCDAIQAGKRYEIEDSDGSGDKGYFQQFFEPPPRALIVEPIFGSKQMVLGLIMVGTSNPVPFDDLKQSYFWNFVHSVSSAVETSFLYQRVGLSYLSRETIAEQLLEAENEAEIVGILVAQASKLIGHQNEVVFHRFENDRGRLIPEAGVKLSETGTLVPWVASPSDLRNPEPSIIHLGIAGHALLDNTIVVADDVRRHPHFVRNGKVVNFISLMSAPMLEPASKRPLGVLSVHSKHRAAFTTENQGTLLYLAKQGAISIARVQQSEELRLKGGVLKEIFEAALEINYETSEQDVAQQLAGIARRTLPFGMVRIRLFDPVSRDLISIAAAGYPEEDHQSLIGKRLPFDELEKYLKADYQQERSFLIPSDAPGWQEFAERYLYVTTASKLENATWDRYDALFTPLVSQSGDRIGFISWDQPANGLHPTRKIIEAVGAFASMASWSIDLVRAYRRIAEQRSLMGSLIASTTKELANTRDSNVMNEVAVKIGSERLSTEACSLYLVVDNQLELVASTYLKNTNYIKRRKQIKAEPGIGFTSWVAATLKPLYFNSEREYQDHPGWAGETDQLQYLSSGSCKNLLFVPITSHAGNCVGVLSFENRLENGKIADFSDGDVKTAMNLAEELGLTMGLAQQLKNVRTLEQEMLEDDLHDLKNQYYYGVQAFAETSLYWLRQGDYAETEVQLDTLKENSSTILNELYGLHNSVQQKYYAMEDFRTALSLLVDNTLVLFVGKGRFQKTDRTRVKIECAKKIRLSPLLRYVILRITSGALMNAIKHSGFLNDPAVVIKVSVKRIGDHIQLIIQDSGYGPKKIEPGYGIRRMRDLVRSLKRQGLDIKLFINSEEGKGTEVKLIVASSVVEV